MFVLRTKTPNGDEQNLFLGKSYMVCDHNSKEFDRVSTETGYTDAQDRGIFAFLIHEEPGNLVPLYRDSEYYVMTGSGTTFAKLDMSPRKEIG